MAEGVVKPVAACYLGEWPRKALDKALQETGWMHSHYVRVAILEKLAREGYLPQEDVDRAVAKAEYRKEVPHGNSKRAKEAARLTEEKAVTGTATPAPARVKTRAELRAERRAKLNGNRSGISSGK